jgi:signal transduction histidine kinase
MLRMFRMQRFFRSPGPVLRGLFQALLLPLLSFASLHAADEEVQVRCTVIMQTRADRIYCYATNQPFRVILKEPERFSHGEVFIASGTNFTGSMVESIPTLVDAKVQRVGETNLPPPLHVTPGQLAKGDLNFYRVAMKGIVASHEWMYFQNRHIEIVVVQGEDRSFRVNVLRDYSRARERWPVGTQVEVIGLSFLELFAEPRGPAVQIDVENLEECQVLRAAPWFTLEIARRIVVAGGLVTIMLGIWFIRERRQIARLRHAETQLEHRVTSRTAELAAANAQLQQAEQELLKSLAQEKELSELKSRFVSMVSHEFRTPLAIIMSSAEILEAYLDRLPPEERAANLKDIIDATRHMGSMVEEVLLLSRVEAGKLSCKPAPLNLETLCERFVDEIASATNRRCPIRFKASNALPEAQADEALLRHIFMNLLDNAVKYSPPNSPVEFNVEARDGSAIFTVRDHGVGIAEADTRQLFQAFHRGHNVGETPGTGLGLTIVKSCVDLHRGKIKFESREGHGSVFSISLPLFNGSASEPSAQAN